MKHPLNMGEVSSTVVYASLEDAYNGTLSQDTYSYQSTE